MNVKNKRNCVLYYRIPNTKQWRIMCPAKSGTWVSLQDCIHAVKLGTHARLEDGEHPVEAEPGTSQQPQPVSLVNTLKNHEHMPACVIAEHWTPYRTTCTCLPAWLCIPYKANLCPYQRTWFAHSSETETGTIAGLKDNTTKLQAPESKLRRQYPQEWKQVYP